MKKFITKEKVICDDCEDDQFEGKEICMVCGKDVCYVHAIKYYNYTNDKLPVLVLCRYCIQMLVDSNNQV